MSRITVESRNNKYGIIYGKIDGYNWYALVQDKKVSYGINPMTLECGWGKVSRLFIYKNITDKKLIPDQLIKSVIADYRHRWNTIESGQKDLILKLVNYLELRYSLKVLRNEAK